MNYLEHHPSIRYVLVSLSWKYRISLDGAIEDDEGRLLENGMAVFLRGLRKTAEHLRSIGVHLVLLADTPTLQRLTPRLEWMRIQKVLGVDTPERYVERAEHLAYQNSPNQLMQVLLNEGSARSVIDLAEALRQGERYMTRYQGEFIFWDAQHLTRQGSLLVGDYLIKELMRIMQEDSLKNQGEK